MQEETTPLFFHIQKASLHFFFAIKKLKHSRKTKILIKRQLNIKKLLFV